MANLRADRETGEPVGPRDSCIDPAPAVGTIGRVSLDASDAATCLSSETLVSVVEGHADPDARARVAEHASLCESCREVLSSLARSGPAVRCVPAFSSEVDRVLTAGTRVGRYVIS